MIVNIDYKSFYDIMKGGALNLEINKALIDSLNVFPVPDGDTGTNMNLTLQSSMKEMESVKNETTQKMCVAIAVGALKGARGNSGVILSQILKGFTEVIGNENIITTKVFAKALQRGSDIAYDVVTNPKEGTILTIIRTMAEAAKKLALKNQDFLKFFVELLKKGEEILNKTPEMLPVLKKAGVVDAGGKGLLLFFVGMYNALAGIEMFPIEQKDDISAPPQKFFSTDVHNLDEIKFAYCTEFFISNLNTKTTISDIDKLRDKLTKIGDCVIVVGDLELIKVHVHTNNPDKALGYALLLGELDKLKVENMLEQNRQFVKEMEQKSTIPFAMVAICAGEGLATIFKDLGVDAVLEGGQTMNPSVADIVNIVNKVRAENVIILPNNKNIVLACEQAMELVKCNLAVIATRTVPEGISVAMNYNAGMSVEENVKNMQKAVEFIKTGSITHAVRKTEMDGFNLEIGDVIGIFDKIVAKSNNVEEAMFGLLESMVNEEDSVITIYYGEGEDEQSAAKIMQKITEKYDYLDVISYFGGQPHYQYFVAVE